MPTPMRKTLLIATAALTLSGAAPKDSKPFVAKPITASERSQGAQTNAELTAEFGGPYAGKQTIYTTTVARRIALQSGLSADPNAFTVTLLDSSVENAFATPGGYVYVTRGLLALCNDEAELAGVLGHEVGHVAARHSQAREKMATRNAIFGALGQAVAGAVFGNNSQIGGLLSKGIGTGAQLATLGYSRGQETEADSLGVRYLRTAGLDTDALSSMLADLAAETTLQSSIAGNASSLPHWASTHPDSAKRVSTTLSLANQLGGTANPRNRDAYLNAIDGMLYGDNPQHGLIQGQEFLHAGLRFAFTAPTGFTMQNGAKAVSITGTGGQAQLTTAAYNGDLNAYVNAAIAALGDGKTTQPALTAQRTTINGLNAAYVTTRATSGTSQVDVTIYAYAVSSTQAYHFVVITPAGQGLGPMASMVQSFHTLTVAQAAAIKPKYLHVVTVKKGETLATIAARMAFTDHQTERFLVLNGLPSNSVLKMGDRVKIVTL